jgi:Ser/Thr protein kinase RdoA (MazF antagonist)
MASAPIPTAAVLEALEAWPIEVVDVRPIPPGATADVFVVRDATGRRWVAKYTYDHRRYVEGGLAVSEVIDVGPWPLARPLRTTGGELTTMVEWPLRTEHPLAMLSWVPGRSLDDDWVGWPELLGSVCGRVHASLLRLDPAAVGVDATGDGVPELANGWDVGPLTWLNDLADELPRRARAAVKDGGLRMVVGVWDGPDIRVEGEHGIGLIDFGHTSWQPLVHVVANRSLIAAYQDEVRLTRFLASLATHLTLTDAERTALPLFRVLNATIYARYMASRRVELGATFAVKDAAWLERLLAYLRHDLPRIGLPAPAG